MSYQALARTWRPRTFTELVGQEHVVRALVNALDDERLHHAYLFTGTRGVGKTTIARILAKCLNCEQGVTSTPCGECGACQEIDSGRFVDLLEVDAASRTKVDDTRELLENVQYTPTRGRYKVYLIDEVHMLSNHSFNALLKTLEEPPPHVKFLLATTDPQKLPVTVLSRCLQFNLKRLPRSMIRERLEEVTAAESIETETGALEQLSTAADGSMRDALSLLDQAAAYCSGSLKEGDVRTMLGTIDQGAAVKILEGLAAQDAPRLLEIVAELDTLVPDYLAALDELALLVQRCALAQVAESVLEDMGAEADQVRALAAELAPEDLQLFYQIALLGKRDLHLAPTSRAGFEMTLLRMLAFRPDEAAGGKDRSFPAGKPTAEPARRSGTKASAPARKKPAKASGAAGEAPRETVTIDDLASWDAALESIALSGAVRQLANHCQFRSAKDGVVHLLLDESASHLQTAALQEKLRSALSTKLGTDLRLRIELGRPDQETPAQKRNRQDVERQEAAEKSIESDPNVMAVRKAFDATVDPASIKPVNH